ncbi:hypothetical protein B0H17DRAFT_1086032 [Mycena rosella]|uniref:F-box domain-containing protein n=1 Tax=Mycena rosella TaxID=1033263 RepID=A0AAD7G8J9_MYCRO|nr:hypothetical protein B0H17DRAFT_1086032 [Mycena rosella]
MGGADTFCCMSGGMHFHNTRAFPESDGLSAVPQDILSLLLYTQEDVDASRDYVMLAPCSTEADGSISLSESTTSEFVEKISPTTSTALYDVVPTNLSYYGSYTDADDSSVYYCIGPCYYLITHSSFVILRHRFPFFHPHLVHKFLATNPFWSTLDYGPVERTRDQSVYWLNVGDVPQDQDAGEWWSQLLTSKDKSAAEIWEDAWMGRGNMWVFVRPDRFPISEAFAFKPATFAASEASKSAPSLDSLPLDIYREISAYMPPSGLLVLTAINKYLRAVLAPQMDSLFFRHIVANEPHLLPAEEVVCYRGSEEFDWWDENWRKGGLDTDDPIPWMAYAKACVSSRSMRNRKRLWDIVGRMEAIAREQGLFADEP